MASQVWELTCAMCGKRFLGGHPERRCCSRRCYNARVSAKKQARQRASTAAPLEFRC